MRICFAKRFFEAAYSLGIDCDICLTTSKQIGTKYQRQYMNRSAFWMIKYMNGSVFSKARYMNGVGFEILARTPVPKLPLSYPHEAVYHNCLSKESSQTIQICHTMIFGLQWSLVFVRALHGSADGFLELGLPVYSVFAKSPHHCFITVILFVYIFSVLFH